MRPVETALHALTLACCVALGAGLWQLRHAPPPPAAPAAPQGDPQPSQALQSVQASLEGLRAELASQRLRLRDLERARTNPVASPAAPARAEAAPTRPDVLAALDDPKVQEKLKRIAAPDANALFQALGDNAGFSMQSTMDDQVLAGLDLNDGQKGPMKDLLKESEACATDILGKVDRKELTLDQGRDLLKRRRAEFDARANGFLTGEQFRKYQDNLQPFRMMTDAMLDPSAQGRMQVYSAVAGGPATAVSGIMPTR